MYVCLCVCLCLNPTSKFFFLVKYFIITWEDFFEIFNKVTTESSIKSKSLLYSPERKETPILNYNYSSSS